MDPKEGDIADGPNGAFLVFKRGAWHPSNQQGVPTAPIAAPEWGSGAVELPDGTVQSAPGSRGGQPRILHRGGQAGGASGGTAMVGADARARFMTGIGPLKEAQAHFAESEQAGNPLNNDWGAALIDNMTEVPFLRNIGNSAARFVGGEDYQNYTQAAASYESALLPILSGAAVTPSEAQRLVRADLPELNDGPEVLRRKARNRAMRINAVAQGIGQAPPYDLNNLSPENEQRALAAISQPGTTPPPSGGSGPIDPTAPKPGDVRVSSQSLDAEDTPESLRAQGYTYDAGRDTWTRTRSAEARGWTPESAVAQRQNMNPVLRSIDAFGRGMADASSLEFADEFAGGMDALFGQGVGDTVGERFRNNVAVQRAIDESDGKTNGFARNFGEASGYGAGAFIAGPRLLAEAGANIASPLLRGAVTLGRNALGGAAIAGTAAAGNARGDALSRAQAALRAAPVGAVVGAVAPAIVSRVAEPVVSALQGGARFAGRQIGRIGEAAGVPNAALLTERATPSALQSAVSQFAARTRRGGPNALQARADAMTAQDIQPALVDATDSGGRGILRALASRQTPARDAAEAFADNRAVMLPDRVSRQARRIVSDDPRSPVQLERDLADARRTNANTAMQPLEGQLVTLDRNSIEGLRSEIAAPAIRQAAQNNLASTDEAVRNSGADLNRLADKLLDNPSGVTMTVRQAQDVSKAMLDAADGLWATNPARARSFASLGRGLRDNARTPERGGFSEYGDWLDKYAEDSGLIDAVGVGKDFIKGEATDFADAVSGLSPDEVAIARATARRAIERSAGDQGAAATAVTRLRAPVGDQAIRSRALLGEEDAGRLQDAMSAERAALLNARNINPRQGSETSLNLQDSAVGAGLDIVRDVGRVARNPIMGGLEVAARRFQARGFSDTEAEALVNAAIDPTQTQQLISMLSNRMSRREARSLARAVQRSLLSGTGSNATQ